MGTQEIVAITRTNAAAKNDNSMTILRPCRLFVAVSAITRAPDRSDRTAPRLSGSGFPFVAMFNLLRFRPFNNPCRDKPARPVAVRRVITGESGADRGNRRYDRPMLRRLAAGELLNQKSR
jgi:hypothetical protein